MLSFFRRGIIEKIMLVVLVVGLVAIVVTGFGTGGMGGLGGLAGTGGAVATVGGESISANQLREQVDRQVQRQREQNPELSTAEFLQGNNFEEIIRQMVLQKALTVFGREHGIGASDKLVDGEIASIPAFHNLAGQFDANIFRAALQQQRMTEDQLRREIADNLIQQQMLLPAAGDARVPDEMANQYAKLLLERRVGLVGLIPAAAAGAGAPPSDAEIQAFYRQNQTRYTVPEQRVIRYAAFGKAELGNAAAVTPAEIEAFYKANQAEYGPTEKRSFSQVVLPSQQAAQQFAAKLAAGASFADAAQQAGFSPADTALGAQTKQQLTELANAAVADAAYKAAEGGTTPPAQSPLGWHIVRVDAIARTPGKSLAEMTDEIRGQIEAQKTQEQLAAKVGRIEDAIADGSSMEELARTEGLTIKETPAVTAGGQILAAPGQPIDLEVRALLKPAFEMEQDDDAEVQTIAPNERFALFQIGRIIAAAPPPLAQIKDRLRADLAQTKAMDRAQAVATGIVAKINRGVPAAQAFTESGVQMPAPQRIDFRRLQLSQPNVQIPAPVRLLFNLPPKKARILAAPQGEGWFVVYHESSEAGDVTTAPGLVEATRGQFRSVVGEELAQEFVQAVAKTMTVKRNESAIADTRRQLVGVGSVE